MISVQTPSHERLGLAPLLSLLISINAALIFFFFFFHKQQSTFDKPCSTDSSSSKHEVSASQCYVTTQQFPILSGLGCDSSSWMCKERIENHDLHSVFYLCHSKACKHVGTDWKERPFFFLLKRGCNVETSCGLTAWFMVRHLLQWCGCNRAGF